MRTPLLAAANLDPSIDDQRDDKDTLWSLYSPISIILLSLTSFQCPSSAFFLPKLSLNFLRSKIYLSFRHLQNVRFYIRASIKT
jgi:hypothetical protein